MLVRYPPKKNFSGALNYVISLLEDFPLLKRDFPLGAGRFLFYIEAAALLFRVFIALASLYLYIGLSI